MKKNFITTLATTTLASGLLAFSAVSSAAPVTGFFDFTDFSEWAALNGQTSATVNGLTFDATGGNITVNENPGGDPDINLTPCSDKGYACTGDGLGINSSELDEIEGKVEKLTISGFGGAEINLISFLDLFDENPAEIASFYINGNSMDITSVIASASPGSNGFFELEVSLMGVNSITFLADCNAFSPSCVDNEFSLAAINAVPVPAAVWLFGSGLIGLVGIARRRKVA